jgi:hypothetical protein
MPAVRVPVVCDIDMMVMVRVNAFFYLYRVRVMTENFV